MTTQSLTHVDRDERPPPIPSRTGVVVDGIESMIIRGQLGPGARLPREKDLALELNILRGPLREGVRALRLKGVPETRQGDGTYATSLDASLLLAPMAFLVILQAIARGDPDAARIRMGSLLAAPEFLHDHLRVAKMRPPAVLDHQPPPVSG
jgi:DNA-binding FadR family transcriptional regulator